MVLVIRLVGAVVTTVITAISIAVIVALLAITVFWTMALVFIAAKATLDWLGLLR